MDWKQVTPKIVLEETEMLKSLCIWPNKALDYWSLTPHSVPQTHAGGNQADGESCAAPGKPRIHFRCGQDREWSKNDFLATGVRDARDNRQGIPPRQKKCLIKELSLLPRQGASQTPEYHHCRLGTYVCPLLPTAKRGFLPWREL